MFGWEEQVKLVDSIYQSLPAKIKTIALFGQKIMVKQKKFIGKVWIKSILVTEVLALGNWETRTSLY
jgi:hypothetical protein